MRKLSAAGIAPLFALTSLFTVGPAFAGACVVADESGATEPVPPTHDIQKLSMFTEEGELGIVLEMASDPSLAPSGFFRATWIDDRGSEHYLEARTNTLATNAPGVKYSYGHTEDLQGITNYVQDGEATGSMSGNTITVQANLLALGNPSAIEVWGSASIFFGADESGGASWGPESTEAALYTIGDSCDAKSDEFKAGAESNLGSDGRYFSDGAGSLGWLSILVGLLGLRRKP